MFGNAGNAGGGLAVTALWSMLLIIEGPWGRLLWFGWLMTVGGLAWWEAYQKGFCKVCWSITRVCLGTHSFTNTHINTHTQKLSENRAVASSPQSTGKLRANQPASYIPQGSLGEAWHAEMGCTTWRKGVCVWGHNIISLSTRAELLFSSYWALKDLPAAGLFMCVRWYVTGTGYGYFCILSPQFLQWSLPWSHCACTISLTWCEAAVYSALWWKETDVLPCLLDSLWMHW